MPKYFPGVSHYMVRTPKNAETMIRMDGTIAMVYICFGADEDHIVVQVKKMEGPTTGATATPPYFTVNGDTKTIRMSGVQGKVANEVKMMALLAFDRVKQQFGLKFGKRYKVLDNTIEEIIDAQRSTNVGQRTAV